MKIEIIEKPSNTSLQKELLESIRKESSVYIASAFINRTAIDFLKKNFINNKKITDVRLLVGTHSYFNKRSDFVNLLKLMKSFSKLEVRISSNKKFHWKYYLTFNLNQLTAFIGSSNFTQEGLSNIGEINFKIAVKPSERNYNSFIETYTDEWSKFSKKIDSEFINLYKERIIIKESKTEGVGEGINQWFKKDDPKAKKINDLNSRSKIYYTYTDRDLSTRVINYVETKTGWDKLDWFSTNRKDYLSCKKASYLLLGNYKTPMKKSIFSLVEIKDNNDKIAVDGNKYFIAYRKVPKTKELNGGQILKNERLGFHSRNFKKERWLNKSSKEKLLSMIK